MGVYTDLIANAKSWDGSEGAVARSRVIAKHIEAFQGRQGDPDYPAGFAAADEVQLVQPFDGSNFEGTYSITITLDGYDPFTTIDIDFGQSPSVWTTHIYNAAQLAGVPIELGDISGSGEALENGQAALTYTGAIAGSKNQPLAVINLDNLISQPVYPSITIQNGGGGNDEIQVMPQTVGGVTDGMYSLFFDLDQGFIIVEDLYFDTESGPVEEAIDTQAIDDGYPGWALNDIAVTGGPLDVADFTFTFSGPAVTDVDHYPTDIYAYDFTDDWDKGATVTKVVTGQSNRTALAAVEVMSLVDSPPPLQGTSSGITAITTRNNNPHFPSQETLQALALQAAIEDGSDQLYVDLMTQFGLSHLL